MATRRFQTVALAMLGLFVLGGCHTHPAERPGLTALDRGPLHEYRDGTRSLAVASDWQLDAGYGATDTYAWYAGRNDVGPSVTAGYATQRYERSVTYTRDRQYTSGGRVFDNFHQTTYRRSVREAQR
ncbi:MAG: hypothetical protein ACE37H_16780 [Phycisphaeraceae bacterium]